MKRLIGVLILLGAFAVLFLFFNSYIRNPDNVRIIDFRDGYVVITDIAYHFVLGKALWIDGLSTIYRFETQIWILSEFFNRNFNFAMPVGVTPMAFLLWLPFIVLYFLTDLTVGIAAWTACSLLTFMYATLSLLQLSFPRSRRSRFFLLFLVLITCCSFTAVSALLLGQTSVIATGALMLLCHELLLQESRGRGPRPIPLLIYFMILALKPPYFLLATALLLIFSPWTTFLLLCGSLGLILAALTLQFGLAWPLDYMRSLALYSGGEIPAQYAQSVNFSMMTTFRSAFRDALGDNVAATIGTTLWLGSTLVICAYLALTHHTRPLRKKLDLLALMPLLIAMYLLFAPYVGAYEDLFLVCAVLFSGVIGVEVLRADIKSLLIYISVIVLFNHNILFEEKEMWALWLLKLAILGYITFCSIAQVRDDP